MEQMEVEKEVAQNSKGDFQAQLEASLKEFNAPQAGQLVEGTVVQITNDYVYVALALTQPEAQSESWRSMLPRTFRRSV